MDFGSGAVMAGLAAGTSVLTPRGWVAAADISEGDHIVDDGGRVGRVTSALRVTGPSAEVRLADAREVRVGLGQRFHVDVPNSAGIDSDWLTAEDISALARHGVRVRLRHSKPVLPAPTVDLPLDGYLVGALLGDGCLSSGESVVLWTSENETRHRVEEALPSGARFSEHPIRQPRCTGWPITASSPGRGRNPVLNGLRELGLSGCKSYEKFIPTPFLWSSEADRVALLNGLLDTDGGVTAQGMASFCSASPQLAADVAHLIRSLGGRCSERVRRGVTFTSPTSPTPLPGRDSYRVTSISLPDHALFLLSRKAQRVRPDMRVAPAVITSVVPGSWQRLVMLEVDSPSGVLVTDGFIAVSGTARLESARRALQAA